MATVPADLEGPSDAELIEAVRKGTVSAYGSLYERHVASAYNLARQLSRSPAEADDLVSEAFAKVLDTLRAGRGPDSAFRAYLLTALRHTAYDKTRRERKVELSDDVAKVSGVSAEAVSEQFSDTAVAGLERSLAAQAFARLPERWQAVLWHTEIEGQSPAEVAPILGLTPNGVSALAYRAREGLRQAYLQVHLAETADRHCRAVAERLGAWTRGGLAKREKAQVEAHLDDCARCQALAAELADVNGAMRGYVAPLVLGVGATGYLATTSVTKIATITTAGAAAGSTAGSAAGAASAGPRQFLGVAASSVALAVAIAIGLAAGGEPQEIPVAAPVPTTQEPPPPTGPTPTTPPPPQQQPPPAPVPAPAPDEPAAEEPPAPAPDEPAPQPQRPRPAALDATGPSMPIALVAGGAPADLPLTIVNSGGTLSEPVVATLNLPAGVTAIPVDGFAARPLLSFNGAQAGTVNCPGGTGTVTCANGQGLAPAESVTLLFRVVAAEGSQGGRITGSVTAGSMINVAVSVQVTVSPPDFVDSIDLAADAEWLGLLWLHPVVEVKVVNNGTSSRPVTVTIDQHAKVRWASQDLDCATGKSTTCTTTAELPPGGKLKVVFQVHADLWWTESERQVTVTARLGTASDSARVTLRGWLWPHPPHDPAPPPPPDQATTPPATDPTKPPTATTPAPGEKPAEESPKPTPPTSDKPPTTAPPTTPAPPPTTTTPPTEPDPPSGGGGLGGLLGWLFGN